MQVNKLLILGVFYLLLSSNCSPKKLKVDDYIQYVKSEKSNLYKKREIGDYKFELLYLPLEYKIALELKSNNSSSYKKIKESLQGMQYYTLKISPINSAKSILKYNLKTEDEYQARLAYFSFGMQKDIYIEQDEKKSNCELYHFERAYDLSNFRVFNLAFEESNLKEDKTVVIKSDFFGLGPIKFKFKKSDLVNLPKLQH